jgi:ABC-type multidrug transport system ATPase subunit
MHLTRIGISRVPPFTTTVEFKFNEKVNLFVGPNASGKSTILRAIIDLLPAADRASALNPGYYLNDKKVSYYQGEGAYVHLVMNDDWDNVPFLYIPAARINLAAQHIFSHRIDRADNVQSDNPLGDYAEPLYDLLSTAESGVFNAKYLELVIDCVRKGYVEDLVERHQFRKAIAVGYSCARSICREVIHGKVPHSYIEIDEGREISDTGRVVHYGMGIETNDEILGEPLYAGALSSGTQGTLLWLYALALKMARHYNWEDGWENKPAILLIDEIENHLHPTWQRRVIPALLEHFPGLQIFATTHSPFVVAGLKAGQVHLLQRDSATGAVTATTNTEDIIGWTADEILRTMLGVHDPTDEETAKNAQKLRQLRKEEPRDTPEKEEERQQEMERLRRLVDRDLLAGGPMAAQMGLFEQQFSEALAQYRQSQTLNQENG